MSLGRSVVVSTRATGCLALLGCCAVRRFWAEGAGPRLRAVYARVWPRRTRPLNAGISIPSSRAPPTAVLTSLLPGGTPTWGTTQTTTASSWLLPNRRHPGRHSRDTARLSFGTCQIDND